MNEQWQNINKKKKNKFEKHMAEQENKILRKMRQLDKTNKRNKKTRTNRNGQL